MNAKTVEIFETTIQDVATVIRQESIERETEKYNINDENVEIKAIRVYKKQSKTLIKINLLLKRIIDIIGSLFGLMILIPLTVIVGIMNVVNGDNGPIFYSHKRIGKNGKYFKMYKFRTMVVDADKKLAELLANDENIRKEWEENRKLRNDPRITKIGKILRKTSLDEFPQFINVLKGDMSLVGPRAVVDDEIEKFGIYKKDILSVKPRNYRILASSSIFR